jgi:hypothetical protein
VGRTWQLFYLAKAKIEKKSPPQGRFRGGVSKGGAFIFKSTLKLTAMVGTQTKAKVNQERNQLKFIT